MNNPVRKTLFIFAIIAGLLLSACGSSSATRTISPGANTYGGASTSSDLNTEIASVTDVPPDDFPRTPDPLSINVTLDTQLAARASNFSFPFIIKGTNAGGSEFYMSMDNKLYNLDAEGNISNAFGTEISMTPISSIEGLPFSQGFLTAVQLGPEGLLLVEPGKLQLNTPGKYDVSQVIGFAADGDGQNFHLYPVTAIYMDYNDTTTFYINVMHFSIYGVASVLPGEIAAQTAHPPTSPISQDEDELAPLVRIPPDTTDLTPLMSKIQLQLTKSHTRLVKPLLDKLPTTKCERVSVTAYRFNEWLSKVDHAFQNDYFQNLIASDANALHTRFVECAKELCPICMGSQPVNKTDMAKLNTMITLATFAEQLSFTQGFDDFAYWRQLGNKCAQSGGLPGAGGSTGGEMSGDATLPTPTPVGCPVP